MWSVWFFFIICKTIIEGHKSSLWGHWYFWPLWTSDDVSSGFQILSCGIFLMRWELWKKLNCPVLNLESLFWKIKNNFLHALSHLLFVRSFYGYDAFPFQFCSKFCVTSRSKVFTTDTWCILPSEFLKSRELEISQTVQGRQANLVNLSNKIAHIKIQFRWWRYCVPCAPSPSQSLRLIFIWIVN